MDVFEASTIPDDKVKLSVHAYQWDIIDGKHANERTEIRAWCLDRNSNPYLLRIQDYPVRIPVELPRYINYKRYDWTPVQCQKVFNYLCWILKDNPPTHYDMGEATKLYYIQYESSVFMYLYFNNLKAMRACKEKLKWPHLIKGIGLGYNERIKLNMCETGVNLVRKLLTEQDCKFSQWFESYGREVDLYEKVSSLDREYIIDWETITPRDHEWVTHPGILAVDIEAHSSNPKAFPDATKHLDRTYMISCVYERYNQPETRRNILILYGISTAPPEGVEYIYVSSEKELYKEFAMVVRELDPEIITGYNLFGFDYLYMNDRIEQDVEEWEVLGRITGERGRLNSQKWQSSGCGHNSLNILEMPGRITIDLLLLIRREHKLPKYDLDTVAKKFLGRGKNEVTAPMMFHVVAQKIMLEQTLEVMKGFLDPNNKDEGDEGFSNDERPLGSESSRTLRRPSGGKGSDRHEAEPILYKLRNVEKIIAWINEKIKSRTEFSFEFVNQMIDLVNYVAEKVAEIGKYCLRDSEAVLQLFATLSVWIYLIQLSNIAGVPPMDLFTRGQQLRGLSLVYNLAHKMGYVLDSRQYMAMSWSGGFVWDPDPGLYLNTICLDFKSLYPNIIRAFNICWTTLIPPWLEHDIDDDKCNIIEWDEPLGLGDYEEESGDSEDGDEGGEEKGKKKKVKIVNEWAKVIEKPDKNGNMIQYIHYRFKFLKAEYKQGVLPQLAGQLIDERNAVRKQMKGVTDPIMLAILEQRQLGLKVTANSLFGMLGAIESGKLPLLEAAMSITAKGRELIKFCNDYLVEKYGASVVYNDSVTGDTPLFVRKIIDGNPGIPYWTRIDDLPHQKNKEKKTRSELETYQVWSDQGWTNIKRVICHYTKKKIYRVRTNTGVVDVTEDHSLLNEKSEEIRPSEVGIGDLLLHINLPDINNKRDLLSKDQAYNLGYTSSENSKIPDEIFQGSTSIREAFLSGVYNKNSHQSGMRVKDKVRAAKLFHLAQSIGHYLTVREKKGYFLLKSIDKFSFLDQSIKSLKLLTNEGQYVYDLETENHHFSAGIGRLVVHNTDSTMVQIPGVTDSKELLKWGKKLELEISAVFPDPLYLEFEKAGPMFVLGKKCYAFWILNNDGTLPYDEHGKPIFMPRGIPLARRDKPMWQTNIVKTAIDMILLRASAQDFLDMLIENIVRTLRGEFSWELFVIIRSLGASYKKDSYFMKIFSDELAKIGCPAQAGDRLEYLLVIPAHEPVRDLLGYKMRTPEIYQERLKSENPEEINYLYYIENLGMDCLEKYWRVGYKEMIREKMAQNLEDDYWKILNGIKEQAQRARPKNRQIVEQAVKDALINNDDDPERAVKALELVLKSRVQKARQTYVSGRSIFDTRLNNKPIKTLLKGYKSNRLEEAVRNLASPELFAKLYPNSVLPPPSESKHEATKTVIRPRRLILRIR